MIKLEFSVDEVNHLLSLLGQLPFGQVNNIIHNIVQQAETQVTETTE